MECRLLSVCRATILACCALLLSGCLSGPHRPYGTAGSPGAPCAATDAMHPATLVTPEIEVRPKASYTLHFLEFDDQGWPYPDRNAPGASPSHKIDCAIGDLAHRLKQDKVITFVYIHGWHHSAAHRDPDLEKFRVLLSDQALHWGSERQVVGFYIGWNGDTIDLPGLRHATFWSRKNAAHKVAEGSVREFFARMKALRNHSNRPRIASPTDRHHQCRWKGSHGGGPDCPLRTIMIGHSFGAWILFASTSPFILETLAGGSDVDDGEEPQATERERGIADLILLLNPAFEATRYDAVFNAARRYRNPRYQPPLLVSVTSDADMATGIAFPVARVVNSLLQALGNSALESRAMKRTHGHMAEYLTHELVLDGTWPHHQIDDGACPGNLPITGIPGAFELRQHYVGLLRDGPAGERETPERVYCGGLRLKPLPNSAVAPYSVVWNIRTHANVIPNHDRIHEPVFEYFLGQMYEDIRELPRFELPRGEAAPGP
jgi:hypothetical protein